MKMVFQSWEIADILKEFVSANYGIPAEAINKEVTFTVSGDQKAYLPELRSPFRQKTLDQKATDRIDKHQ